MAKNNGLCISPLKNLVVHEGIKKIQAQHTMINLIILGEYQLDEIDITNIRKKSRWDDDMDNKFFDCEIY